MLEYLKSFIRAGPRNGNLFKIRRTTPLNVERASIISYISSAVKLYVILFIFKEDLDQTEGKSTRSGNPVGMLAI